MKTSFFAVFCVLLELASCLTVAAQDNRFVVFESGRHGYINQEGVLVIPIILQGTYVLHFSEGLVSFSERVKPEPEKIPYVDKDGKLRLFPQEKWGFIDTSGAVVIAARFDAAAEFSQGLAAVATDTDRTSHSCTDCDLNQRWGFIDKSGKEVIPLQYRAVSSFSEGLAAVMDDGGKWGYIDTKGELIIPFSFERARPFSKGLAAVAVKKQFGYIDKQGHFVIKPQFTIAKNFSEGLAAVRTGGTTELMYMRPASRPKGGTWTFIGPDGKKRIDMPNKTVDANEFAEGFAAIYFDDDRCGYVDTSGAIAISPTFSFCGDFSEHLADVSGNGKLQYIDNKGQVVLDTPYDGGRSFKNGLAWVEEGTSGPAQKFGYINNQGKQIWKPRPAL